MFFVFCFLLAQHIPFNPEERLWDFHQVGWLFLAYIILSLPFFFAANTIALSMANYRQLISRIYAFDLVGAGIGSIAIVGILFIVIPLNALYILGILALLIGVLACWELRPEAVSFLAWLQSRTTRTIVGLSVLLIVIWTWTYEDLQLSPYKGLSQTLRITGSRWLEVISPFIKCSSPLVKWILN